MFRRHTAFTVRAPGSSPLRGALHGRLGSLSCRLVLPLILAVAAALRLYGVIWDGGYWLHPDERQIYFVANSLGWPQTLPQAVSSTSPLNPHFFAYGSLPIYLLKLLAVLLAPLSPVLRDPGNLHLIGRPLSALLGVGTVALTYRLARRLWDDRAAALLGAALLTLAVLPIQASHFFTTDVLFTFLAILCLNLAADVVRGAGASRQAALGVAVGLALATKLTAAPLLLLIPVSYWLRDHAAGERDQSSHARAAREGPLKVSLLLLAVASITFLLVEPYAALDWRTFLADTVRESQIAWGRLDEPYTRQYAGTLPFLYSIWQTALWGIGLPLGLLGWSGFVLLLVRWLRQGDWADMLLLAWTGPTLAVTGLLYARPLRYMLPLVPVLCILAARMVAPTIAPSSVAARRWLAAGRGLLLLLTGAYALAFASIYAAPHSWITTSEWIYRHVPAGTSLAVEEWDTPLPLPVDRDGRPRRIEEFRLRTLALYAEPDAVDKWSQIAQDLAASDYLIIASRRLYGSIPRLSGRYPVATRYYSLLFTGELGFQVEGEFTRGPAWLNPRIGPLGGAVPAFLQPDESFLVYDHPRVLVFRNADHLSPAELLGRLGVPVE
jgi:hypothetical protein